MPRPFIDITGRRFGRLVAIKVVVGPKRKRWECRCDCGGITVTDSPKLITGHTKSCGCFWMERVATANLVHGHSFNGKPSPEWRAYNAMHNRCKNKNGRNYEDYGARGIKVCERWTSKKGGQGFPNFLADMGLRPSPDHSLDRISVNGDYEPSNCRWATRLEQGQNTRRNRMLTFRGETRCVSDWVRRIGGITASMVYARLDQGGWTVEKALSTPRLSGAPLSAGIKPTDNGSNQGPRTIAGPGGWML